MVMLKLRLAGMFGLNGMVEKMGKSFLAQEGVLFNLSEPVEEVYDRVIGACQKMGNPELGSFYRAEKMGWKNMLHGTMALEAEEYDEAISFYKKVPTESSFSEQALSDGIGALVNTSQEEEALEWFAKLPMTLLIFQWV